LPLQDYCRITSGGNTLFETIVLATDLSPAWNEIVACAGELRALGCKRVILTHVISVKFMSGMEGILQSTARPQLEAQQQQLEAQGLQVTVEIAMGLPADSLNQIACRYGAGLIVAGSHGQSLWREGVLGCFTCAVLHNIRYPVLLLKVKLQKPGLPGSCQISQAQMLRHVLLPTDFSAISSLALEYVERLAAKGLSQVTVLNALDVPGGQDAYPPGYQEIAEGRPGTCWRSGSNASWAPEFLRSTTTLIRGIPCPPSSGSWNPRISR